MAKKEEGLAGRKFFGLELRDLVLVVVAVLFYTGVQDAKADLDGLSRDLADTQEDLTVLEAQVAQVDENQARIDRLALRVQELAKEFRGLEEVKDDILEAIGDAIRLDSTTSDAAGAGLEDMTAEFDLVVARRRNAKCFRRHATIHGSREGDTLIGTGRNDVIVGGRGPDVIFSSGGKDRICGGRGNDALFGDGDEDQGNGGRGNDYCEAEIQKRCEEGQRG